MSRNTWMSKTYDANWQISKWSAIMPIYIHTTWVLDTGWWSWSELYSYHQWLKLHVSHTWPTPGVIAVSHLFQHTRLKMMHCFLTYVSLVINEGKLFSGLMTILTSPKDLVMSFVQFFSVGLSMANTKYWSYWPYIIFFPVYPFYFIYGDFWESVFIFV